MGSTFPGANAPGRLRGARRIGAARPVTAAAALLCAGTLLLGATACDGGGEPAATSGSASSTAPAAPSAEPPRDPIADLDPTVWTAASRESLMGLDVQAGGVDRDAWAADGIDAQSIEQTRAVIAGFLGVAYFSPEELRPLSDQDARSRVLGASPTFWQDTITEGWNPQNRFFYATQFAEPYRTVGPPRLVASWYLAERDGTRYVEAGGTVVYSVIDPETGRTGTYAIRFGAVAEAGTGGPVALSLRVAMGGMDSCASEQAGGLVVPALGDEDAARRAQTATRTRLIDRPAVSEAALADPDSSAFSGDPELAVFCD